MELFIRLHRILKDKKDEKQIIYVPESICWTEAPSRVKGLRTQRERWHKGLIESLWKHHKMFLNPKYGSIGMVSLPYYFAIEFLGPIIEFIGYSLIVLSLFTSGLYVNYALIFLGLSIVYGSLYSMAAVLLEEWSMKRHTKASQFVTLFLWSMTESFWYRPLTVIWRLKGMIGLLFGNRKWGEIDRKGVSN